MLARKQGFLLAGVRRVPSDRTAFIALPGGVGTLDEMMDLLALRQLGGGGAASPSAASTATLGAGSLKVPLLLMNYDGCYDGLVAYLKELRKWNMVDDGEVEQHCIVCRDNYEALKVLIEFYAS